MVKYFFECMDETSVRATFAYHQSRDFPCREGRLGNKFYDQGIHFTECGEMIRGFYLDTSEDRPSRASHTRVCFCGRFVERDGKKYLAVWIYPHLLETLFLLLGFVLIFRVADTAGLIFSAIVCSFFGFGYVKMIRECAEELARLVR